MENVEFTVGNTNYIGKYCIGGDTGFCVMFEKKPNRIHRYFMKTLLGWEWINE